VTKAQDEDELVGQLLQPGSVSADAALGTLWKGQVVVRDAGESSRLHNKGNYGRPQSGGALELDLIEASLLLETGRMRVVEARDGVPIREIRLEDMLREGVARSPEFEVRYFVFRDLRLRGYLVKAAKRSQLAFLSYPRGATVHTHKPSTLVGAIGERDAITVAQLARWAEEGAKENLAVWLALVDEEGDVTYYGLSKVDPRGDLPMRRELPTCRGVFLEDRVLVWDNENAAKILGGEWIGRPVAGGLQLSLVESAHLLGRGLLDLKLGGDGAKPLAGSKFTKLARQVQPDLAMRLSAYDDLKRRGLVVKTGFKFGAHFRAYTKSPGKTHAQFLVHCVQPNEPTTWPELARAVRLAHSVRKELLFAVVGKDVEYLRLSRLRP
jgi:tRNA-intron endonuclease